MKWTKATLKRHLEKNVFVIAEAGVNHNGDENLAYRLIDAAKSSGADAVKFQTFVTDLCVSRDADLAAYQKGSNEAVASQRDLLKRLELPFSAFRSLKAYCDRNGIMFLSTPDETVSLGLLLELEVPAIKIASGDVTNLPFLAAIGKTKLPVFLSTGASTILEVREANHVLRRSGVPWQVLMQCVSEYPAPEEEQNLLVLHAYRRIFRTLTGFSDHTLGTDAALGAVALGASVIEKHITLDKTLAGPDHQASMNPLEFRDYVARLRRMKTMLGDGEKRVVPSEQKNQMLIRKSLYSARALQKGDVVKSSDILAKRPGDGMAPKVMRNIVGSKLLRSISEDEAIKSRDMSKPRKRR